MDIRNISAYDLGLRPYEAPIPAPILVECISKTNQIKFDKKMFALQGRKFCFHHYPSGNLKGDLRKIITKLDIDNIVQITIAI